MDEDDRPPLLELLENRIEPSIREQTSLKLIARPRQCCELARMRVEHPRRQRRHRDPDSQRIHGLELLRKFRWAHRHRRGGDVLRRQHVMVDVDPPVSLGHAPTRPVTAPNTVSALRP